MSGPGTQPDVNGVATVLGTMVLRVGVCVYVAIAVVGATMVTPAGREARGKEGTIRLCFLVYLRRCGDGPL